MIIKNRGNYFKIKIEDKIFMFSYILVDLSDLVNDNMSKREYKKIINDYLKYIKINYGDDIYSSSPIELDYTVIEDLEFKKSVNLTINEKDYKKLDKIIKNAIIKELEKYKTDIINIEAG